MSIYVMRYINLQFSFPLIKRKEIHDREKEAGWTISSWNDAKKMKLKAIFIIGNFIDKTMDRLILPPWLLGMKNIYAKNLISVVLMKKLVMNYFEFCACLCVVCTVLSAPLRFWHHVWCVFNVTLIKTNWFQCFYYLLVIERCVRTVLYGYSCYLINLIELIGNLWLNYFQCFYIYTIVTSVLRRLTTYFQKKMYVQLHIDIIKPCQTFSFFFLRKIFSEFFYVVSLRGFVDFKVITEIFLQKRIVLIKHKIALNASHILSHVF